MSAKPCPSCKKPLPEATLRALAQGTSCPFCAAPLKVTPRHPTVNPPIQQRTDRVQATPKPPAPQPPAPPPPRSQAPAAPPDDDDGYAAFQVSAQPLPGVTPPLGVKTIAKPPVAVPSPAKPPLLAVQPAAKPPLTVQPVAKPSLDEPSTATPPLGVPPAATPPLGVPPLAASPLMAPATRSRTQQFLLMGAGATIALALGIGLIVGLKPSGGGKANASVTTPATPPSVETVQLAAVAPAAAPGDAPPAAAADDEPSPRRRHAVRTKRKPSVAHHGKRQNKREVRMAKAEAKQRLLTAKTAKAAKRSAPSAPAPAERGDPRAPYERGNALLFAGDAAGAVAAYREAVQESPTDPIGYRGLGLALELKGDTTSAIRALHKYLKLAPGAADRKIISRRIDRLSKSADAK